MAVATSRGCAVDAGGFDPAALREAWSERGEALVDALGTEWRDVGSVWDAEVDVLFAGSKPGVVDHSVASEIEARALVAHRPVPVTAKALSVLGRRGVQVLPDFVAAAAPLLAHLSGETGSPEALKASVVERINEVVGIVARHDHGPYLGACMLAEDFMKTWLDDLPFGRPLA